jgi:SSS family solute:Na+ symporter
MMIVALYSALSGLWGVVITDAFQFFMAMSGCIILAILVLNSGQIGGIEGLQNKLPESTFRLLPIISNVKDAGIVFSLSVTSFLAYVGIIWWASWYPGAEPGGGGYVAQRMMSAKDEKHSLFATLFFQIAHYGIRPWPWIIVGLCSLVLYPNLAADQKGLGYIYVMNDFLPAGLKGLLVAAFFAAYMSTIATQLNWGTSYLINDFYRRFLSKNKNETHYVKVSRVVTILLMIISAIVTLYITTISGAWIFIMECGAGLGLVLILRWYWWRINAWTEISAMICPFVIYPVLKLNGIEFPYTLFILVSCTTFVWLIVTYLTKPTSEDVLFHFYRRVHPGGILWGKISQKVPEVKSDSGFLNMLINWIAGVILVYSFLFGTGSLILGDLLKTLIFASAAILSIIIIYKNLSESGWETLIK